MSDTSLEQYLDILEPRMDKLFASDSSGHDLSHSRRTMRNALAIQEREGGDRVVVGIAALLHDVHRAMENETGTFVAPVDSLDMVRSILADLDLDQQQVDQICYCVEHHEDYNWNGDNVDDLNALIVQDADNLDAVGAVGIARAFSYGGARGVPLYDPSIPLEESGAYAESGTPDESTIHHFYHKSLRLARYMNTKTGAELAEQRSQFMRAFVEEFLAEWA